MQRQLNILHRRLLTQNFVIARRAPECTLCQMDIDSRVSFLNAARVCRGVFALAAVEFAADEAGVNVQTGGVGARSQEWCG